MRGYERERARARERERERERERALRLLCPWGRHPQVLHAPLSSNQAKIQPLSFPQATLGLGMGRHSVTQHLGLVPTPGKPNPNPVASSP